MTTTTGEVRAVYEAGQYFSAYQLARRQGLLRVGRETPPRDAILAARILAQAGAPRRARKIILETWRRHRGDPEAALFCGAEIAAGGPLAALELIESIPETTVRRWSDDERGDWSALRARELAGVRDFAGALRAWEAARALSSKPWIGTVRAIIEHRRDRADAALEAIAEVRASSPWYRPAVDLEAHVLHRLRRFDDLRALLVDATARLESVGLQVLRAIREREDGALDASLESLARAVTFSPEMERVVHDGFVGMFAQLHYLRGDVARSVAVTRLSSDAEQIARAEEAAARDGARVVLPVPHVPQHHHTCAPATLTSIAEHWGVPVDHLDVAEEICHDGTPAASERRWAVERGFVARELTLTWDAIVALIDRGVPIHLTTVFTTTAHAQAIVGYDARRRTILVRDPGAFALVEYVWDALASEQAAFGPRGLVLVPSARAALLDGIELPDAELHDLHHAVDAALRDHDRAAAIAAYDALVARAPAHRLCHQAQRAIASYDGDDRGVVAWADALLAAHPDDPRLLLAKLGAGRDVVSRAERIDIARRLLAPSDRDPAVLARCAAFFAEEGDVAADAARLARLATRTDVPYAPAYRVLADALWADGERERALRLYRFTSCLAEGDEGVAWSYFLAARIVGRVDEALEHLQGRVDRMLGRSALPARTLGEAYGVLGRAPDAIAALERARAAHPDDGLVLLGLVEELRRAGDLDGATRRLEEARGRCHDDAWRRAAAELAAQRGARDEALALWRETAEAAPLDLGVQQAYVVHLELAGRVADAGAHLRAVVERFPHHLGLARLLHAHLREHDPPGARRLLEGLVERHPGNGWARFQLAGALALDRELAAAREHLARARDAGHEPAAIAHLTGYLARAEGRRDDARAAFHAAIAADADAAGSIAALLELARDKVEAEQDLARIAAELERQGSHGAGLFAYAEGAADWLDARRVIEVLRALRSRRSHLSEVWSGEVAALVRFGRLDEAAEVAGEAVRRFEQVAAVWRDLASVHHLRGDATARLRALERAHELAPAWTELTRQLADAAAAAGDLDRARALLADASAAEPANAANHGYLAEILRGAGADDEARAALIRAVQLHPEYGWGWDHLRAWYGDERAAATAREVLAATPRATRPRIVLAEAAGDLSLDERVALLAEVVARTPDLTAASDLAATLLAEAGRWDEALAACRPAFWGDAPPIPLRGRAAWVLRARGDHREARDAMLAAIRLAPSYEWGIRELVAWGDEDGDYLGAAERVVDAAPSSALAHAHLGEARRELGRPEDAERALRRALELDGRCRLARLALFDVLLARGRRDEAAAQLDGLGDDASIRGKRVQLAAAARDRAATAAALERLLAAPGAVPAQVAQAVAIAEQHGVRDVVVEVLDAAVAAAGAGELVARAWFEHVAARRPMRRRWREIRALPEGEARGWCASAHVEAIAEGGDRLDFAIFLIGNLRTLRGDAGLWGSTGWGLLRLGMVRWCRRWLRDFPRRAGVEPWMLHNLARAHVWLRDVAEGWRIGRRALALPPDHAAHHLRVLLAPADALEDAAAARGALVPLRRQCEGVEQQFLVRLAEAIVAYREHRRGADLVADVRRVAAEIPGALQHRVCRHVLRRVVRDLAAEVGGLGLVDRLRLEVLSLGW